MDVFLMEISINIVFSNFKHFLFTLIPNGFLSSAPQTEGREKPVKPLRTLSWQMLRGKLYEEPRDEEPF